MSSITTTNIQSIILKPGEQFTLPPGATLISATDVGALDSTCPLDDNLESIACYVFLITIGDHDDTDAILWDSSNFRVRGWRYKGVDFDDMDIQPTGDAGALPFSIIDSLTASAKANGIYLESVLYGYNSGDGDNGTHNFVVVKTIPSVAAQLEIKTTTGASFILGDTYTPAAYIHPVLYTDMSPYVTNIPPCT